MAKKSNPRPGRANRVRPQGLHPELNKPSFAREILVCTILTASTVAVYFQIGRHGFISFDDGSYVFQNPMVNHGLSSQSVIWAFRSWSAANWHPLTWLSHMLDCQIFGVNPGPQHLVSLGFHLANTLLLYWLFRKMTGRVWPSAMVAALFALHPLHVESVAWIAERKDVLSAFFFMLTLGAYLRYAEVRSIGRYLIVVAALAAGLMAKPMLVTVPFVLLLLDCWPLRRAHLESKAFWAELSPLVREKVPLFAMVAVSSFITYFAQLRGEAVASTAQIIFPARIANSITSYVSYLILTLWPSRLAILYPYHIGDISAPKVFFSLVLMAAITCIVVWQSRRRGFLLVGWFWYLGMLVPVIGLVQVGSQAQADRYTYLPLIGIFAMIAWALDEAAGRWPGRRSLIFGMSLVLVSALAVRAYSQVGYWKDGATLYERTLAIAPSNPIILTNMGSEFAGQRKFDEAIRYYERSISLQPNSGSAHAAMGSALAQKGEYQKALEHLEEALRLQPSLSTAHYTMGVLLMSNNKVREATPFLQDAVRLDVNNADAHNALGAALLLQGNRDEAVEHFKVALAIRPGFIDARNNLKVASGSKPAR